MPQIELAPAVAEDVDRVLEHCIQQGLEDGPERIRENIDAISVLERSPEIGRPLEGGLRELVIGRQSRGYLALYRYLAEADIVFVLALRSQREAGYRELL